MNGSRKADQGRPAPTASETHSVVLRLDPGAMENPDLEIRWEIEEFLRAAHPAVPFRDDGYGFARSSDAMLLSYATSDPDGLVAALLAVVTQGTVGGNAVHGGDDRGRAPGSGGEAG